MLTERHGEKFDRMRLRFSGVTNAPGSLNPLSVDIGPGFRAAAPANDAADRALGAQ